MMPKSKGHNTLLHPVEPEDQVTEPYTLMPLHPDNGSNNWAVDGNLSNTGLALFWPVIHTLRLPCPAFGMSNKSFSPESTPEE